MRGGAPPLEPLCCFWRETQQSNFRVASPAGAIVQEGSALPPSDHHSSGKAVGQMLSSPTHLAWPGQQPSFRHFPSQGPCSVHPGCGLSFSPSAFMDRVGLCRVYAPLLHAWPPHCARREGERGKSGSGCPASPRPGMVLEMSLQVHGLSYPCAIF